MMLMALAMIFSAISVTIIVQTAYIDASRESRTQFYRDTNLELYVAHKDIVTRYLYENIRRYLIVCACYGGMALFGKIVVSDANASFYFYWVALVATLISTQFLWLKTKSPIVRLITTNNGENPSEQMGEPTSTAPLSRKPPSY